MNRSGISNEQFLEKAADIFTLVLATRASGVSVTGERLQELTGIDKRIVADIVRAFQKRGFPIISGQGYKWAGTRREWLHHLWKERQRFKTGLSNINKAAKNYTQIDEPTLFT